MNRLNRGFLAVAAAVAWLPFAALADAAPPGFPAEATLAEVLGFRTRPGLDAPFVIKGHNYLAAGTRLKLVDSTPEFGSAGAFCRAEALGHKGYFRCDRPQAFRFSSGSPGNRRCSNRPGKRRRFANRRSSNRPLRRRRKMIKRARRGGPRGAGRASRSSASAMAAAPTGFARCRAAP